jgi:hypothetical protein
MGDEPVPEGEVCEKGNSCSNCLEFNAQFRSLTVGCFATFAVLVGIVWGIIRLATDRGLSLESVLLAAVVIAVAGACLYWLITWWVPCGQRRNT